MAWAPLAQGDPDLLTNPILTALAERYNKTVQQVALRYFCLSLIHIYYSQSIRHWKLNMGIRYEQQQTDYYEKGIRIDAQSPTYNDIIPVLAASWSHNGKSFSILTFMILMIFVARNMILPELN